MTDVGCTKRTKIKCIAVFPGIVYRSIARFMKTVHVYVVRLEGRPRRFEVGFSHCPSLNWISAIKTLIYVNSDSR